MWDTPQYCHDTFIQLYECENVKVQECTQTGYMPIMFPKALFTFKVFFKERAMSSRALLWMVSFISCLVAGTDVFFRSPNLPQNQSTGGACLYIVIEV